MKSASKILYTIGKIINIIELISAVILLILGIVAVAMPEEIYQKGIEQGVTTFNSSAEVKDAGIKLIVAGAITFVVALVVFIMAKKATKSLKENSTRTTPHIIMLVIGVFGDIFYFLGGLFGVLSANQNNNQNQTTNE